MKQPLLMNVLYFLDTKYGDLEPFNFVRVKSYRSYIMSLAICGATASSGLLLLLEFLNCDSVTQLTIFLTDNFTVHYLKIMCVTIFVVPLVLNIRVFKSCSPLLTTILPVDAKSKLAVKIWTFLIFLENQA